MSVQRLNQLISGARPNISVESAARLEDVLQVPRGCLFRVVSPDLVEPYVRTGAA